MTNPSLKNRHGVSKHSQFGFSLLETLVAFAVLVLVLAVTFQVYASGSRSTRLAYEYTKAVIIAQSKLAEFQAGTTILTGIQDERYHWQLARKDPNYKDLGMDGSDQRSFVIYDIDVIVTWNSVGKQRSVHIDTVQLANKK
jgi:general secretion pathway protein I